MQNSEMLTNRFREMGLYDTDGGQDARELLPPPQIMSLSQQFAALEDGDADGVTNSIIHTQQEFDPYADFSILKPKTPEKLTQRVLYQNDKNSEFFRGNALLKDGAIRMDYEVGEQAAGQGKRGGELHEGELRQPDQYQPGQCEPGQREAGQRQPGQLPQEEALEEQPYAPQMQQTPESAKIESPTVQAGSLAQFLMTNLPTGASRQPIQYFAESESDSGDSGYAGDTQPAEQAPGRQAAGITQGNGLLPQREKEDRSLPQAASAQPAKAHRPNAINVANPAFPPLSFFTTSEQLRVLKLLKNDLSEVLVNQHGGNYLIEVSTLRNAQAQNMKNAYDGKYEEKTRFTVFAADLANGQQIESKRCAALEKWRGERQKAASRNALAQQQKLAQPYMATPRTVSWLHQQAFLIFQALGAHYVSQAKQFDKQLKYAKYQPQKVQQLTPFKAFVEEIYAFATFGRIQKAELFKQELLDAGEKYCEISSAARLILIFSSKYDNFEEKSTKFPHREQSLTKDEADYIYSNQNIIMPIMCYVLQQIKKQTVVQRIETDLGDFKVQMNKSAQFQQLDLQIPRVFDGRVLQFPLSKPILANALQVAFKAYQIDFSAQFVIVELERLQIWKTNRDYFEIELFSLLENIVRIVVACMQGFGGFFEEQEKKLKPRLSIEEQLGI